MQTTNPFLDFLLVILVLSISIAAMLVDMYIFSYEHWLNRFKKLPVFIQKQAMTLVVAPLLLSPLLPQLRWHAPFGITLSLGAVLGIAGAALIAGAFTKIGVVPSIRAKSNLLTTGVYGLVRHPIYSGTLLAFLGVSLMSQAWVSTLYWPIAVFLYLLLASLEERQLMTEYGEEYITYKSRVKARLIPFIV